MNNLINTSLSMTSREIAELTAKTHAHVLRDIDNLLETLNPELASGFKASTYVSGDPPREYRQFILDRDSAYCLVAGYDANARIKIIKRWQELEAQLAQPTLPQLFGTEQRAFELSVAATAAAKAFGFEGNQAILSADKAVRAITGFNFCLGV